MTRSLPRAVRGGPGHATSGTGGPRTGRSLPRPRTPGPAVGHARLAHPALTEPTTRHSPRPLRRETFRAPQDRVLVITWWDADYDAELPELPDPDGELVTRAVHRWRFRSVGEG